MTTKQRTAQQDDISGGLLGKQDFSEYMYLEERFAQLPILNADIAGATGTWTLAGGLLMNRGNKSFEVSGTNSASATTCTYDTTYKCMKMVTAGADNDRSAIFPHQDAAMNIWQDIGWDTAHEATFSTVLMASAVTYVNMWAGFDLAATTNATLATALSAGADQVRFWFETDTPYTTWQIAYSIDGTDALIDTGITVEATTWYKMEIRINADRKALCYINGELVGTTTALTTNIAMFPTIGLQELSGAARSLYIPGLACSQLLGV